MHWEYCIVFFMSWTPISYYQAAWCVPKKTPMPPTPSVGNPLNLQVLYLRENNISKLDIDTFKGLTALQETSPENIVAPAFWGA